jgi:hypothetical protein
MRYHKPVFTPNIEAANEAYLEAYARWIGAISACRNIRAEADLPRWSTHEKSLHESRRHAWESYVIVRNNWIAAHAIKS